MAYLTPEDYEIERTRKEEKAKAEAAAAVETTPTPTPTQQTSPPATAASTGPGPERLAAEGAEEESKESGIVTDIGNMVQQALDPLNYFENQAMLVEQLGKLLPLSDEQRAMLARNTQITDAATPDATDINEGLASTGPVGEAIAGLRSGSEAGVMIPFTISARLSNQDSPWSDPPEAIKGSPYGETAFAIAEILTPTLLLGIAGGAVGLTGSAGTAAVLVGESALETATQDSSTDLLAGKELSIQMGRLATELGFDGEQLTVDLIEGTKPNAQAITAVAGFFQNLGINFGADQLLKQVGKLLPNKANDEVVEAIAERTGKPKEEVAEQLNQYNDPKYDQDFEPHQTVDVDSMAAVGKPSPGNKYVSEEHLQQQLLNNRGLASDGTSVADRDYFTNWGALSGEKGLQDLMSEVTTGLRQLRPTQTDIDDMVIRAKDFLDEYTDAASGGLDVDEALLHFPEVVIPLQNPRIPFEGTTKQLLREGGRVTEEGYIVGAVLAEEMSLRMQLAAKGVINLETGGIDFTKQIENLLDLNDKAHDVLVPLRRGKRYWSVTGSIQQRQVIEGLTDPSETLKRNVRFDAATKELETQIKADTVSQSQTLREVWEAYKGGDADAGKNLKDYLALLSASRPRSVLSNVENLTQALRAELKKGAKRADKSMFYSYMLTRLSPQTASLGSNILQLVKQPIGTFLTGNRAEAVGQFLGGWAAGADGMANAMQAFKTGKGMNSGSKVSTNIVSLKEADKQLDRLWEALEEQMIKNKVPMKEQIVAKMSYWRQKISHHPVMDVAMRGLLAQDEWAKTVFAGQVATGRAFKKAKELGFRSDSFKTKRMVIDEMNKAFKDGRTSGIKDPEILEAAKRITFQGDIPKDNPIDRAFATLDEAAQESEFFNWVSPFTRISYKTLEANAVTLSAALPGGPQLLQKLVPRYQRIMSGEMGEVAQMQLKSDLAFGQYWSYVVGGAAAAGMMTGQQPPEGLPRTSFIIPAPGTETGYIAIPYGRMEPLAMPMSIIADLITALKTDAISNGDYQRGLERVMTGIALASVDKTFTSGFLQTAELFDVKNWSDYTLNSAVRMASGPVVGRLTGGYGGLTRMVTSWTNPAKTVTRVNDNPVENLFLAISSTLFSGAGSPVIYDPLSGKPQMKTSTLGGNDNYWAGVFGSFFNELIVPGKVQDAKIDSIHDEFNRVGYDYNMENLRSYNGIPLNGQQISALSKDIHDHGKLQQRLSAYFKTTRYKQLINKLEEMRSDSPTGNTSAGSASMVREQIHTDIRKIENEAKTAAVTYGSLAKDPEFVRARTAAQRGVPINSIPLPDVNSLLVPTR